LSPALLAQGDKPFEGPLPIAEGGCNPGNTANLCIPVDGTHTVVNFDGPGGSGPANHLDPCQRNDDDTTTAIALPFTFDLFGTPQNSVFINNNGNISFGAAFTTFTSTGFPINNFPMIAPFWADVDTRNPLSGVVYYKLEANRLTVTWDHVGYYNSMADRVSTFQVIISDGTDPLVGLGQNVCFCYGDMDWTTGDASSGVGGFGGTPATVGINAGDGVNFFQLGRFDQTGNAYDGPGGTSDGVDFLDNTRQCFLTGTIDNTPPIFINSPTGCLNVSVGVPFQFTVQSIGPEAGQHSERGLRADAGQPGLDHVHVHAGRGADGDHQPRVRRHGRLHAACQLGAHRVLERGRVPPVDRARRSGLEHHLVRSPVRDALDLDSSVLAGHDDRPPQPARPEPHFGATELLHADRHVQPDGLPRESVAVVAASAHHGPAGLTGAR